MSRGIDRRALLLGAVAPEPAAGAGWKRQRIGANCFNRRVLPKWMDAAEEAGIGLVRVAYEKWGERDFLLGSADDYRALRGPDLKLLIGVLDGFARRRMGVVLVPLSLPGARWRQKNGGRRDGRLWKDFAFQAQAAQFWRDLAGALQGHPAVAALDILNEPAPELEYGRGGFWDGGHAAWAARLQGTAGDLNAFNRRMIEAVRSKDGSVGVVVESGLYATPWTLEALEPVRDENVLYSIHMYEPYEYTAWRKHQGKLSFPGEVTLEEGGRRIEATREWLSRFFDPVRAWMKRNRLPAERLLVGEFGCGRRCPGADRYLAGLIRIFDRERWHWMFYSFREDTWEGMDYELGAGAPPGWYWDLAERGQLEKRYGELYGARGKNPIWSVLGGRLRAGR